MIAIGIWSDLDIPAIWRQVVGTLRSLFLAVALKRPPSKSALSQARSRLGPGPLRQLFVLQDRGFYGYRPLAEAIRRGVHVLGRVSDHVVFKVIRPLRDGSYLAMIYPSLRDRRHNTNGLIVRVIGTTVSTPGW